MVYTFTKFLTNICEICKKKNKEKKNEEEEKELKSFINLMSTNND